MTDTQNLEQLARTGISRRRFFGYAGALAGAGLLAGSLSSCQKEDDPGIDIGSGDTGVFNYLYTLAQLQAAFYIQSLTVEFAGMNARERSYLTDIRQHELAHREFYRNILGGGGGSDLEIDLTSIDFHKRTDVLDTAIMFEDLSVSAYNGAAQLISTAANLTILTKIGSVEARHAAALRDVKLNGTFADTTVVNDVNGLDLVRTPYDVLPIIQPFFKKTLNISNLPTS